LALNERPLNIRDADFMFENRIVRVAADRDSPEIELAGFKVGPFEKGKEYELRLWLARELEKAGIVHIRDEVLEPSGLRKIHWTERIQTVSRISSLPKGFYPRLRRLLSDLKESSRRDPEKIREYELVRRLSQDIVDCRLKKIVSLASTLGQKDHLLKNLTVEEMDLYEKLNRIISEWRFEILKVE